MATRWAILLALCLSACDAGDLSVNSIEMAKQKFEDNKALFERLKDIALQYPNLERADIDSSKNEVTWKGSNVSPDSDIDKAVIETLLKLKSVLLRTYRDENNQLQIDVMLVRARYQFYSVEYRANGINPSWDKYPCEPTSDPKWFACKDLDPGF